MKQWKINLDYIFLLNFLTLAGDTSYLVHDTSPVQPCLFMILPHLPVFSIILIQFIYLETCSGCQSCKHSDFNFGVTIFSWTEVGSKLLTYSDLTLSNSASRIISMSSTLLLQTLLTLASNKRSFILIDLIMDNYKCIRILDALFFSIIAALLIFNSSPYEAFEGWKKRMKIREVKTAKKKVTQSYPAFFPCHLCFSFFQFIKKVYLFTFFWPALFAVLSDMEIKHRLHVLSDAFHLWPMLASVHYCRLVNKAV